MGERKVINKYYPPDFDPSLLPKKKRPKDDQVKIRLMLPMTVCCNRCGEFVYKGKKFNSKKEDVANEDYLGIKIFRFYIKCTRCAAEITFKTDPKHGDYAIESGATRNYEPWKEEESLVEEENVKKKQREGDAMAELENRTLNSLEELERLEALSELQHQNDLKFKIDSAEVLSLLRNKVPTLSLESLESLFQIFCDVLIRLSPKSKEIEEKEDEETIQKIFSSSSVATSIKRIEDTTTQPSPSLPVIKAIKKKPIIKKKSSHTLIPGLLVKPKDSDNPVVETRVVQPPKSNSLFGSYSLDSSSDSD